MSKEEEAFLVKITARRRNGGIAFSIEWTPELDKHKVQKILNEIIQGINAWKREQILQRQEAKGIH